MRRGKPSNVLHLFPLGDPATGDDDNLVFFVKCYNLSNTVGGAGVVDIAGKKGEKVSKRKTEDQREV